MAAVNCTKCGTQVEIPAGTASVTCPLCQAVVRAGSPPQTAEWYYLDAAGQQQGPVAHAALSQMVASGTIGPATHVWKQGMAEWQPVQNTEFASSRSGRTTGQQPQEVGKIAYEEMKTGVGSVGEAMKVLFSDPMGGQSRCLDMLGEAKAFQAGIVFSVAFAIVAFLYERSILAAFGSISFFTYVKLILISCIPPVALAAGFLGIGKIFGGRTNLQISGFTTGVALVPVTIAALATWILGMDNLDVVGVIAVFCGCITISLLNASLNDVQELSTRKVILLSPTLVIVAMFITRVLMKALLSHT